MQWGNVLYNKPLFVVMFVFIQAEGRILAYQP